YHSTNYQRLHLRTDLRKERKRPMQKKEQSELVSKCQVGENGARRAVSTGIPVSQPLRLSLKWEEEEMIVGFSTR
ncbi:hypothetical protein TNCT_661071, partial [Trichonephila clavata]